MMKALTESVINQDLCARCKQCVAVCPNHILALNETGAVDFIPERSAICIQCGQCMAICQTGAINIKGLSYERDLVDLPEQKVDYERFIGLLKNRRSVRNFKKKPLPDALIEKILETIYYAPFGAHPEKMHITVINDRAKIESVLPEIAAFLDHIVTWIENPISAHMIRWKKGTETFNTIKNHLYPIAKQGNYKLEYGDRITRGAPALLLFHAEKGAEEHTNNGLIYATYAMLAAQSLNLGATMNGIVSAAVNKLPAVREAFQIPHTHETVISLILGYPKYKYRRAIRREKQQIHWRK